MTATALAAAAFLVGAATHAEATSTTISTVNIDMRIASLRIVSGPYRGGFRIAPGGRLQWYFANIGLIPYVARDTAGVRSYLELYLAQVSAIGTIKDVRPPSAGWNASTGYTLINADSDDAYAATFLTLVARYVRVTGDLAWFRRNLPALKVIATRNLVAAQKSNGLIRVFQSNSDNGASAVGYLQDNAEDFRGLRDFAATLRRIGDPTAVTYERSAVRVADKLDRLFSHSAAAYRASDADRRVGTAFYPDAVAQIFPQAMGVAPASARFAAGWRALNRMAPHWWDGSYDAFPWAIVGYTAALRHDCAAARRQRATVQRSFGSRRSVVTINELGWLAQSRARCP